MRTGMSGTQTTLATASSFRTAAYGTTAPATTSASTSAKRLSPRWGWATPPKCHHASYPTFLHSNPLVRGVAAQLVGMQRRRHRGGHDDRGSQGAGAFVRGLWAIGGA